VIRNKQHLAALRPYDGLLLLETMYYVDEVRNPQALDGDLGTAKLQKAEVEMAKSLVENLSEPFKPEKYDDTYRKELLDLIRAKAEGQPLPEPAEEEGGEVVDLMAALRESVERTKKQRKAPSKRKAS
jgi:DNA end-binding protein Ku